MDDQRIDREGGRIAETLSVPIQANTQPDTWQPFRNHLYRAKLTVYGSLLAVGLIQIVLREQFPQINPLWPWIGGALMAGLLGYLVIPPIIYIMRRKKY
jgi:hypothetical protein